MLLSWILLFFEALSRLKINMEKSSIIPVGNVGNLDDMALEVGCRTGTLPYYLLGPFPLRMRHNASEVWDVIEENSEKSWPSGRGNISQNEVDLRF